MQIRLHFLFLSKKASPGQGRSRPPRQPYYTRSGKKRKAHCYFAAALFGRALTRVSPRRILIVEKQFSRRLPCQINPPKIFYALDTSAFSAQRLRLPSPFRRSISQKTAIPLPAFSAPCSLELTALSGHMGRDFRRLQGACLVIGGAIWVAFSIRPAFIWLSAFFGLMMTLAGLSLFFFKSRAFTGYLGLVYSVVCALMLMMSGIGLYVARQTPFSELSYLLQSFLAFCAFCSCGIVCFLESRRQRS